jgi:anti-sigma-K factor RskA
MNDQHIIGLIEETPFVNLSSDELSAIRAHADECPECLHAFQAAEVSALLLKERVAAEFETPPFFHTRVLAILRERQAANDSWAFARLWRAAGALASSMVAAVALLAVLTFAFPDTRVASGSQVSALNAYSAEEVILDQTPQPEEVSDSQLLSTIYDDDDKSRDK